VTVGSTTLRTSSYLGAKSAELDSQHIAGVGASGRHHHTRTLARERERARTADSREGTGDEYLGSSHVTSFSADGEPAPVRP